MSSTGSATDDWAVCTYACVCGGPEVRGRGDAQAAGASLLPYTPRFQPPPWFQALPAPGRGDPCAPCGGCVYLVGQLPALKPSLDQT
jgi:hypothetical protein